MAYQYILYETGDRVARISLNRPQKLNALNYPMRQEIVAALKEAERDDEVRVIIIRGMGRSFSSGIELTRGGPSTMDPPQGFYISRQLDRLSGSFQWQILSEYRTVWNLLKPVIAQVHGYCLTGAYELAVACDLRIVAEDAIIGDTYRRVRAVGHLLSHPWLMGLTKGKEMILSGDSMSGVEAVQWGWANHAYPADRLEEETERLAARIAQIPGEVLMLSKRACNRS